MEIGFKVGGWLLTKTNPIERIILLAVAAIMLVPNLIASKIGLSSDFYAYTLGAAIYALVFIYQRGSDYKYA